MVDLVDKDVIRCFVPKEYREDAVIRYGKPGWTVEWKEGNVEVTFGRLEEKGLINLQIALHTVQDAGNVSRDSVQHAGGGPDPKLCEKKIKPLKINEVVVRTLIPASRCIDPIDISSKPIEEREKHGELKRPSSLSLYDPLPVKTVNEVFRALQEGENEVTFWADGYSLARFQACLWQRKKNLSLLVAWTVIIVLVAHATGLYGMEGKKIEPTPIS